MKTNILRALLVASLVLSAAPFALAGNGNGQEKVTICHAAGLAGTTQFVEITVGFPAAFGPAGHFFENGTPQAGHEQDILGPCPPVVTVPTIPTTTEPPNDTTTTTLPPEETTTTVVQEPTTTVGAPTTTVVPPTTVPENTTTTAPPSAPPSDTPPSGPPSGPEITELPFTGLSDIGIMIAGAIGFAALAAGFTLLYAVRNGGLVSKKKD